MQNSESMTNQRRSSPSLSHSVSSPRQKPSAKPEAECRPSTAQATCTQERSINHRHVYTTQTARNTHRACGSDLLIAIIVRARRWYVCQNSSFEIYKVPCLKYKVHGWLSPVQSSAGHADAFQCLCLIYK